MVVVTNIVATITSFTASLVGYMRSRVREEEEVDDEVKPLITRHSNAVGCFCAIYEREREREDEDNVFCC